MLTTFFELQNALTISTSVTKKEHAAMRVTVTYVTTLCKPNGTDFVELLETKYPPLVYQLTVAVRMRPAGCKEITPPLLKELSLLKCVFTGVMTAVVGPLTSGFVTATGSSFTS